MDQPNPPQPQQMNWSYFKPEFSGKAEEDAAVHLLKTNNWMAHIQLSRTYKGKKILFNSYGRSKDCGMNH